MADSVAAAPRRVVLHQVCELIAVDTVPT
jgi:hypothetical protein